MINLSLFFPALLSLILAFSNANAQSADNKGRSNAPVVSDQKFYDVELIIFKFNTPIGANEVNLPTPTAIRTAQTIGFSTQAQLKNALDKGFQPLKAEEFQLTETAEKLTASSRYTILNHTGWRQPGLGEDESLPVWITGGKIYGKGYSSIDQHMPDPTAQPTDSPIESSLVEAVPVTSSETNSENSELSFPKIKDSEFHELEGMITIILSRYLHTKADLVLRKPATADFIMSEDTNRILTNIDTVEGQLLLNYGLNEKRRMRSKKLHYMDNPQFGMLVLITPFEVQEIEKTEEVMSDNEQPVPFLPTTVIAQ